MSFSRGVLQREIADRMAIRIVDALEMIDVDHHQRELLSDLPGRPTGNARTSLPAHSAKAIP